jgi:ABC-type glycerol-3-phosphate transport system substrate-binding protein
MKRISAVLAAVLLAAACGSDPTAPAAAAGGWQADASAPPADSTGTRVPNIFGSGN